jgi:hypothetical protein
MRETNAWWVDKNNQPSKVAKILNNLIVFGIKIYGYYKSVRKTKRNSI